MFEPSKTDRRNPPEENISFFVAHLIPRKALTMVHITCSPELPETGRRCGVSTLQEAMGDGHPRDSRWRIKLTER